MSRSVAAIDLAAVAHNVEVLSAAAGQAELCAVVKANGYGHGAERVARVALAAGATRLAVAQVDEGLALRSVGIEAPIMVLGEPASLEFGAAATAGLEITVYTPAGVRAASEAGADAHLMVDTGMHRSGCRPDEALGLAGSRDFLSVWTHLACADDPDSPATDLQLDRFEAVVDTLRTAGRCPPMIHAANTAGTLLHPRSRFDMVRCGIGLYGLAPSPAQIGCFDLRPVMRLATSVAFVKRLAAGDRASYGLRGSVDADTTVATIPIGYADGVRRSLWEPGEVLIGGKRRRILGVVTMDQTIVDCGDDPVSVGDEVVLIGIQGSESVTADDWARWLGTINYEVVCGIGDRVDRVSV